MNDWKDAKYPNPPEWEKTQQRWKQEAGRVGCKVVAKRIAFAAIWLVGAIVGILLLVYVLDSPKLRFALGVAGVLAIVGWMYLTIMAKLESIEANQLSIGSKLDDVEGRLK